MNYWFTSAAGKTDSLIHEPLMRVVCRATFCVSLTDTQTNVPNAIGCDQIPFQVELSGFGFVAVVKITIEPNDGD